MPTKYKLLVIIIININFQSFIFARHCLFSCVLCLAKTNVCLLLLYIWRMKDKQLFFSDQSIVDYGWYERKTSVFTEVIIQVFTEPVIMNRLFRKRNMNIIGTLWCLQYISLGLNGWLGFLIQGLSIYFQKNFIILAKAQESEKLIRLLVRALEPVWPTFPWFDWNIQERFKSCTNPSRIDT